MLGAAEHRAGGPRGQADVGGRRGLPYDTGRFLVTSLDLSANSEVTLASPEQPCLGLDIMALRERALVS